MTETKCRQQPNPLIKRYSGQFGHDLVVRSFLQGILRTLVARMPFVKR